jgi:hypothetical protein
MKPRPFTKKARGVPFLPRPHNGYPLSVDPLNLASVSISTRPATSASCRVEYESPEDWTGLLRSKISHRKRPT